MDETRWLTVYPPGVPRGFVPPAQALGRFLAGTAAADPHAVALRFEGRDVSRGALRDAVRAAGARFRALPGTGPGDRVAIVLQNCPEFVAACHGAIAAGLVAVPASPHLPPAELAPLLADTEPRAVVCDAALRDAVASAVRLSGVAPVTVIAVRPGGAGGGGFDPELVAGAARIDLLDAPPDAPAVLQATSGTTGGLKAARMTHRNLVANALQNNLWFGWTAADVVLGALPLCHTWGLCCVMNATLAAGARAVLLPHADAESALDAIERERVTVAYGSATMFHRLLDAAGRDAPERLRSLRYVKAGAMLVGGDLCARWHEAVPGVPMVNGYGLTEASPEVSNNPPHAVRAGTVGVPLPGTELRLAVPEDPDREAAPGEDGEVQVRGPQVTPGYWRRPDATAAAFAADGWLRTGDLGAFDEAGYLVLRDRLRDLVKFRGWSVVPGAVERALREHPAFAEACVVGVPHAVDGEEPVAFVVLRAGASFPGDADLRGHLAARLARYEHPRRFHVVPEIPKNHVGKPLRRVLRERAAGGAG